ncbi:hypothetical protein AMS68_003389 [Peltaster fructicola]|uniref:CNH domain-containing protein n=1 Tax=Peltaster fructicola TaxID=286661 RepID=A0A6H0XSX0_9PEZI|nr:hypothetical protein AMS68_003389 [Peltaster fructicola]
MLAAFTAQPIHEHKPKDKSKIEALLAYGDRLLVGLSNGTLRIYRVNEDNSNVSAPGSPPSDGTKSKVRAVDLLSEKEQFSKKPIQQLAIVKEANLLVSLSDGYISLHDLQSYSLVERLEKTKGALCFAVTSNVLKDPDSSIPTLVSRLVVGVKRKLMCWTWTDMELSNDVPEINMEDAVKTLTWATDTKLAVGMDAGFSVVDVLSGEITPVNKPASRLAPGRDESTPGELGGVRFAAVSSSGMGYMGMSSWVPRPMSSRISGEELLFAKDVNTLFTDLDGKPTEKRQVPWSYAPEAIGYSHPYLLALQQPDKGVLQIRNPDTLNLLQSIPVPQGSILHVPQPRISLAHAGKGFLVASERTIWRMNALSYPTQIDELVAKSKYDEAISFLGLLEDTLIDDKLGRIREVRVKKGEALFRDRKYRPALDLFTDAQASVDRVVRLYPRSIAGDLSSITEVATSDESADETTKAEENTKEPPSTPSKSVIGRFRATQTPQKSSKAVDSDTASLSPTPRNDSDNVSIRSTRTPARNRPQDRPLEGDDLRIAVLSLCSYLAQSRQYVQKFLNFNGTLKEDPPTLNAETHKPAFADLLPQDLFQGKSPGQLDWQAELLKVAQLVDTTLFRSYMLASPSLAGPLFRLDNFCDPDVVQTALYENQRYGDLIDFLHGKKLHRQSLEMLQKFGKGDVENEAEIPEGLNGPERTVAYLKQLPPGLLDLVLEFVQWPIEVDQDLGLDVFTADSDNAEHMDRRRVLEFLAERAPQLEQRYLEHIIDDWHDTEPDFHQRLVELYIQSLKSGESADADLTATQRKLEELLRTSEKYNRGQTFRLLDAETPALHESRAIVLTAMGNYKQALSIYVYQIRDYDKAEERCAAIYLRQQAEKDVKEKAAMAEQTRRSGAMGPTTIRTAQKNEAEADDSVFAMLLGLYLRPPVGEDKRWPQALELLSKHGSRLPASNTLDLMPDDLAVQQLQDYFRGRMRFSTTLLREDSIVKGLEGVRRVRTEATLLLGRDYGELGHSKPQGRNRRVVVREEDHCKVCHKRFRASAVRAWPDGSVTHYGCVPGKEERPRGW